MRAWLSILVAAWVLGPGPPEPPVLSVPLAEAPSLDGVIGEEEWGEATRVELDAGGEAWFQHDGRRLHVAIRGAGDGWSHVYLADGDTVRVLHASAALGAARYVREAGGWVVREGFVYTLRDTTLSADAEAARASYFAENGWVATVMGMGASGEQEISLRLDRIAGETRLAVLRAADPSSPTGWPALLDDTRAVELVRGDTPSPLRLETGEWAGIVLVARDPRGS